MFFSFLSDLMKCWRCEVSLSLVAINKALLKYIYVMIGKINSFLISVMDHLPHIIPHVAQCNQGILWVCDELSCCFYSKCSRGFAPRPSFAFFVFLPVWWRLMAHEGLALLLLQKGQQAAWFIGTHCIIRCFALHKASLKNLCITTDLKSRCCKEELRRKFLNILFQTR